MFTKQKKVKFNKARFFFFFFLIWLNNFSVKEVKNADVPLVSRRVDHVDAENVPR